MRSKSFAFSVLVAVAVAAPLQASQHTEKKASAGKAVLVAAEDLKWEDVPGSNGGKVAVVKGDSKKGTWSGFLKLPAGASVPLHSHTADHQVTVVSGTMTLGAEGGEARKLGPGSWFEFTGKKKHTTVCEAGADCVLSGTFKGPFDILMPDAPKAAGAPKTDAPKAAEAPKK